MSSDLSRRGFSGWFMEILVLNMEVLGLGLRPPLEPFLLKSVLKRCESLAGALWQWHLLGRSLV